MKRPASRGKFSPYKRSVKMNSRADWVTLAVAKDNFCSCKYALTVHAMTVTLVHILLHESHLNHLGPKLFWGKDL